MGSTLRHDDQKKIDDEHLKLLSWGYYGFAGLSALGGLAPILHLVLGILIATGSFPDNGGGGPPAAIGIAIAVFAGLAMAFGWGLAALNYFAGLNLARRQKRWLCQVAAGVDCLFIPLGTTLGVLSLIVLNREGVKAQFGEGDLEQAYGAAVPAPAPVAGLAARPRASVHTRCPYCHEDARDDDDVVACTACLAKHHEACWGEQGSCSNCGGRQRFTAVETDEPAPGDERPTRRRQSLKG